MKKNMLIFSLMLAVLFMGFTNVKAADEDLVNDEGNIVALDESRATEELDSQTIWRTFVEKYKNTSLVKKFTADGHYLNVVETDSTLSVTAFNGTSYLTVEFTYEDGILTYIPLEDKKDRIAAKMWVDNCLYALSDMKGYNIDAVKAWIESKTVFSITVDGIEVRTEDYECEEGSFWLAYIDITGKTYTHFKLDLRGLKETPDNVVKNPDTGISTKVGAALIGLLVVGTFIYSKSRKYSKFPQA